MKDVSTALDLVGELHTAVLAYVRPTNKGTRPRAKGGLARTAHVESTLERVRELTRTIELDERLMAIGRRMGLDETSNLGHSINDMVHSVMDRATHARTLPRSLKEQSKREIEARVDGFFAEVRRLLRDSVRG